jgi:hypothetical protein
MPLVAADYLAGMTRGQLAKKYDRSKWTITSWLKKQGVCLRDPAEDSRKHNAEHNVRRIEIDENDLRLLYLDKGWSSGRIALAMGVWREVIEDRIALHGLVRTPEQEILAKQESRRARKRTCNQRFGGDSPNADPDIRARTEATNLDRYGHVNPFGSDVVKGKIRTTNLDRHGVENPLKDPERASRVGKAVSDAASVKWTEKARNTLSSREDMLDYMRISGRKTVPLLRSGLGVSDDAIYRRLTDFDLWEELDTSYHTSAWEREVGDTIRSWNIPVEKAVGILNSPTGRGRDIDWFSPEHRIGVECNGSLNHSEARREDTRYHLKKTKSAEAKGIFLYHLFSYEWANPRQRPIVESQLRNRFGLVDRRIGARSCEVVEVSPRDSSVFLDENHLQGRVGAKVRVGLSHNGELVAVMTFSPPRQQKRKDPIEWELVRYAVKRGVAVLGGADRLFKRFVKEYQPESIVSYSDRAKTTGDMYPRLGFELANETAPDYVWWKSEKKVLLRYQCMAHKLKEKYKDDIPGAETMSEAQIMHYLGYSRIYGCGNKVWVWRKKGDV